LKCRAKIKFYL